ncbi:spore gernimation protein, partial [Bacillus pumilus]
QRDGTLTEPPLDHLPPIAAQSRTALSMLVTNLANDKFSDELGRILLNNQSVKATFLNDIVRVANKYQSKEIHFDFEYLRPA